MSFAKGHANFKSQQGPAQLKSIMLRLSSLMSQRYRTCEFFSLSKDWQFYVIGLDMLVYGLSKDWPSFMSLAWTVQLVFCHVLQDMLVFSLQGLVVFCHQPGHTSFQSQQGLVVLCHWPGHANFQSQQGLGQFYVIGLGMLVYGLSKDLPSFMSLAWTVQLVFCHVLQDMLVFSLQGLVVFCHQPGHTSFQSQQGLVVLCHWPGHANFQSQQGLGQFYVIGLGMLVYGLSKDLPSFMSLAWTVQLVLCHQPGQTGFVTNQSKYVLSPLSLFTYCMRSLTNFDLYLPLENVCFIVYSSLTFYSFIAFQSIFFFNIFIIFQLEIL